MVGLVSRAAPMVGLVSRAAPVGGDARSDACMRRGPHGQTWTGTPRWSPPSRGHRPFLVSGPRSDSSSWILRPVRRQPRGEAVLAAWLIRPVPQGFDFSNPMFRSSKVP